MGLPAGFEFAKLAAQVTERAVVAQGVVRVMHFFRGCRQQRTDEEVAHRVRSLATRHQPARCKSGRRRNGDVRPRPTSDSLAEIREEMTGAAVGVELVPLGMTGGRSGVATASALGLLRGVFVRPLGLGKILRSHTLPFFAGTGPKPRLHPPILRVAMACGDSASFPSSNGMSVNLARCAAPRGKLHPRGADDPVRSRGTPRAKEIPCLAQFGKVPSNSDW